MLFVRWKNLWKRCVSAKIKRKKMDHPFTCEKKKNTKMEESGKAFFQRLCTQYTFMAEVRCTLFLQWLRVFEEE